MCLPNWTPIDQSLLLKLYLINMTSHRSLSTVMCDQIIEDHSNGRLKTRSNGHFQIPTKTFVFFVRLGQTVDFVIHLNPDSELSTPPSHKAPSGIRQKELKPGQLVVLHGRGSYGTRLYCYSQSFGGRIG